jgi:hypothetical protein
MGDPLILEADVQPKSDDCIGNWCLFEVCVDRFRRAKRVVTTRLESALVPRAAISGSSDATVTGCALLESHDFSRGSGFKPWAIASPNHRSGLESARDSAQAPSRALA